MIYLPEVHGYRQMPTTVLGRPKGIHAPEDGAGRCEGKKALEALLERHKFHIKEGITVSQCMHTADNYISHQPTCAT